MMQNRLILYNYWQSSCSWRVRAVLEYKRIPYQYHAIDILSGGQHGDHFRQNISPVGQLPVLQFEHEDGTNETVFQSMAIVDFLQQLCPEPSVYPVDPIERARVVAISQTIVSGIQPLQHRSLMAKIEEMTDGRHTGLQWTRYWIGQKLAKLEAVVRRTAGRYTVGDQVTLADFCLVPQIYNARKFGVAENLAEAYPTLDRLNETLLRQVDAIERARPENQPDYPAI